MSFDVSSLSVTRAVEAPRIIVYGVEGIGKSTFLDTRVNWANGAPAGPAVFPEGVIYQACEPAGAIETTYLPGDLHNGRVAGSFEQVIENISAIAQQDHDFNYYVLDSLSSLERLIFDYVMRVHEVSEIKAIEYGKGYDLAALEWGKFMGWIDALTARGIRVLLLGHADIVKKPNPAGDEYTQYSLAVHKKAYPAIVQPMDALLFANYVVYTNAEDAGFNRKVAKGIGTGERKLYTQERPSYRAKNRYALPPEMDFDYAQLDTAITSFLTR